MHYGVALKINTRGEFKSFVLLNSLSVHSRKNNNCFHKTFTLKKEKNCVDKIQCNIPSLLFLLKNVFYILMKEAKKGAKHATNQGNMATGMTAGQRRSLPPPTRCSSSRAPCDSSLKVSEFIGSRRRWCFFGAGESSV